ncbi:MAG: S-methyl-5'-thioadenosine phosphorylase [Candidatus Methanomethylicia archaeon]
MEERKLNIKIGVIGGSGFEEAFEGDKIKVKTPYGEVNLKIGVFGDREVAFIHRHGEKHEIPPHRVNYRGNIWALKEIGVERIIATNAVGGIRESISPGDILIPHDFIDFTKSRIGTFYNDEAIHVDVSEPYCPEIRRIILECIKGVNIRVWDKGVYVCTEGPRFETPSEIRMFRLLGADVVGMTGVPEVVLARELKMCYASICIVTNYAAGLQKRVTQEEVNKIMRKRVDVVLSIMKNVIQRIPIERKKCECGL